MLDKLYWGMKLLNKILFKHRGMMVVRDIFFLPLFLLYFHLVLFIQSLNNIKFSLFLLPQEFKSWCNSKFHPPNATNCKFKFKYQPLINWRKGSLPWPLSDPQKVRALCWIQPFFPSFSNTKIHGLKLNLTKT